jgi:hypothetical protein
MSSEAYAEQPARAAQQKRRLSPAAELALIIGVALLLLVPCFWQPHIIAGDLPSHLYNAWLAAQIEEGVLRAPGLTLAHPVTNVLADLAMKSLIIRIGRSGTERIVVAAAVEIFFWGAFLFVAAVAGQRCWVVAPSLGIIAYGLIFQMGFLNFYLSTGFSVWMVALLWRPRRPWCWLAFPCAVLALLGHPLPLAWAAGTLLYVHGLRWVPESRRWLLFIVGASMLILIRAMLVVPFPTAWFLRSLVRLEGILGLTGTGQLWLYGAQYLIVVAGILIIWFLLFLERLDRGSILEEPVVHIWGLNIVAYILLPDAILFPHYTYPIQFMHFRLSLFIAILFCAMVAGGAHGRGLTRASSLLAAGFFGLLYLKSLSFSQVESELARLTSNLPPGERVVAEFQDYDSPRLNGLVHVTSSVCLGRCWDYGNYEPSSGAFALRVSGPNGIVTDQPSVVNEIESGQHVVTPAEAPVYTVCQSKETNGGFELRRLGAGEVTCLVRIPLAPHQ